MGCLLAPVLGVIMVLSGAALTGLAALFMGVGTLIATGMTSFIAFLMILI